MSTISRLVKSGAWLSLANIISKLTNAFALPVLARILGPQALGIYNIVISLTHTVQSFSGLGVEIALQRNGAKHEIRGKEATGRLFGVAFTSICSVNAVMGLGVWLLSEPLAERWLAQSQVSPWLGFAAILIVLQPIGNLPLLFLTSLQDFRAFAIRSSLGLIVTNAIILLLTWRFGLLGATNGLILSAIAQIIWSYVIVQPVLQAKGICLRLDRFWQEARSILKLGLPYYFGTNFLFALINLPLIGLVSQHGGLDSLGYLRAAQSIASLVEFIPMAIAPAVISHLSASSTDDNDRSGYLKSVHLRGVWILLLLFASGISLFLPQVIARLFGDGYQPAIVLAWIFLWSSILTGITAVFVQYLIVDGKTLRVGWGSTIGAICWVIPALVLIPRYGVLGFAIAHSIGSVVEIIVLAFPAIKNIRAPDLFLLANLLFLTGCLFAWTVIVGMFSPINVFSYLISIVIAIASVVFIYKRVFHTCEQIKLKKTLYLLFAKVGF